MSALEGGHYVDLKGPCVGLRGHSYHLRGSLSAQEGNLSAWEGLFCSERAPLRSTVYWALFRPKRQEFVGVGVWEGLCCEGPLWVRAGLELA